MRRRGDRGSAYVRAVQRRKSTARSESTIEGAPRGRVPAHTVGGAPSTVSGAGVATVAHEEMDDPGFSDCSRLDEGGGNVQKRQGADAWGDGPDHTYGILVGIGIRNRQGDENVELVEFGIPIRVPSQGTGGWEQGLAAESDVGFAHRLE